AGAIARPEAGRGKCAPGRAAAGRHTATADVGAQRGLPRVDGTTPDRPRVRRFALERYGDRGLVGLPGSLAGAPATAHYWHVSARGRHRERTSTARPHPRAEGKRAECRATARALKQAAGARLLYAAVARECAASASHHAALPAHRGQSALSGQAARVFGTARVPHPRRGAMAVDKASR